jgi:hypothetical protein
MTDLVLTGQQTLYNDIAPKILVLKQALDLRANIWSELSFDKKKAWIVHVDDPIMQLAWDISKYFARKYPDMIREALERES